MFLEQHSPVSSVSSVLSSSSAEAALAGDAIYSIGYDMLQASRWRDASDVFRAMLLLFPNDERSWLGLGQCHQELGQLDVATELLGMAAVALPNAVRTRVALVRLLKERQRYAEADAVFDQAEAAAEAADDDVLTRLVEAVRRES